MTEDLLIKEKGFRQMNKEIEQKAHDLMKNIDHVINTYNDECSNSKIRYRNFVNEQTEFSENTIIVGRDNLQVSVKRNTSLPYIFDEVSSKLKIEAQKDHKGEVWKKGNLANATIVNLFKSKIDILQKELQTLQCEYRKKCDVYKDLEIEHKKFETKSQNEIESLKDIITKLENTNKELQCQSLALNNENSIIKKDLDKLQKQIKILSQQSNNYSTRLNRSLENNDKLRSVLKCSQIEEKELRNQVRKLQNDKRLTVNNLGKQLSEIVHVFKKQMLIIDNLKKQNACLIAIGQLRFTKEDFSRLLDQKPDCL
ncbi:PREDICTED: uncharacterized protein LOC107189888 [Dufourea novaeangliae]|uniref:Testis-expressed sequence 9 protein n=1 Tax=Dufourea novaeangliae TaxID=178035 RepID=A0A154PKU6_DUFNO|nr:PREDICTED: uncharacterized protein LOC107189888 [Dufourea novaeangliae]KZC11850.1 Testis-expressed sequence 9 protein [Dufourea novaeangliae]